MSRIVGLSQKIPDFSKPSFIFHLFIKKISHKNSETNPLPPIVNVVCKYLSQCLGTSFDSATLPICCSIE